MWDYLRKQNWSKAVVWRYTLIQIPGIVVLIVLLILVEQWIDLPLWLAGGLVLFWIAKDIVLFPLVWRAYDWEGAKKANSMIGLYGVSKEDLTPRGYIQIGNERWRAEAVDKGAIKAGEKVKVVGIRGLWLAVELISHER